MKAVDLLGFQARAWPWAEHQFLCHGGCVCQLHETLLFSPTGMDKLHGFVKCGRKTCHSFTATKISASANLPNPPLASEAGVTVCDGVWAFPQRSSAEGNWEGFPF